MFFLALTVNAIPDTNKERVDFRFVITYNNINCKITILTILIYDIQVKNRVSNPQCSEII